MIAKNTINTSFVLSVSKSSCFWFLKSYTMDAIKPIIIIKTIIPNRSISLVPKLSVSDVRGFALVTKL